MPRVGVLGGGQLGQMLMLAGYPLGISTTAFDHSDDGPAASVGKVTAGSIQNSEKLHRWAAGHDVITYETENIPAELVADLSEVRTVLPGTAAIAAAQDRWHEKRLFDSLEIPVTPFRLIHNRTDLEHALEEFDEPIVVKTRTGGYDGKGQVIHRTGDDPAAALELMQAGEVIAEQWVPFQTEVSVIGVRCRNGTTVVYPVIENEHRRGILHASMAPARITADLGNQARDYMLRLLDHLDYVGVLTLELFVVDGRLIANEMAPRVHNSGHWTIEGSETSQFENHLRAICGMPLGNTSMRSPTAMINLIGRTPETDAILAIRGAHLHLYGKSARPGRKLGHVTITAPDTTELHKRIACVEEVVTNILT